MSDLGDTDGDGEIDLSDTLSLWVPLLTLREDDARQDWAEATARQAVERRGLGTDVHSRLAQLLNSLALEDPSGPASWRLMYFLDPGLGASVWHIAFLRPSDDAPNPVLVGADELGQLGEELTEFVFHGLPGTQHVRFDLGPADEPSEQPIEARAAIALTRDLGHTRVSLLAVCQTRHLEALTASLVPMQYLLTSPELEEWVAAAGG